MSAPTSDNDAARPFIPARDFALSQRFYDALGFTSVFANTDVAIYTLGKTSFLLQNYFQQQWAENFMMQLVVDDLDGWWAHIESLDLPAKFGVPPLKAPVLQPWGLVVGYMVDPSGVLWHVVQRN